MTAKVLIVEIMPIRSVFRSLKTEWVPTTEYRNFSEAKTNITKYISGYYSQVRPHQHKGGLTANESEQRYGLHYNAVVNYP
ncbi:IS3 family transposase [Thalassotalea sp. PLHSN55]|uniref:IS3 family transposase n=1 Tax=Thalassotalea sp. PLHSN55 TaxID=3435888 RepID=UPI003F876E1A